MSAPTLSKHTSRVLVVLPLSLLLACHANLPPVASPVANGAPGPVPEVSSMGVQSAPPPAPVGEDRVVAQSVRADLKEAGLSGIHVKVTKGLVRLRGQLPPGVDREAVLARIAKLPGVDRIDDQMRPAAD